MRKDINITCYCALNNGENREWCKETLTQVCSKFHVVRVTSAQFDPNETNIKSNAQDEG